MEYMMQKLPFVASLNFDDNTFKTHARNISLISTWFTHNAVALSINECLEVLAKAHGYNTYAAINAAIKDNVRFEDLQNVDTYFERLRKAFAYALESDKTKTRMLLLYVARYINEVEMDLNQLKNDSKFKGAVIYTDGIYPREIIADDLNFLAPFMSIAVFNTIQVQSLKHTLPKQFTLHKSLLPYMKDIALFAATNHDVYYESDFMTINSQTEDGDFVDFDVSYKESTFYKFYSNLHPYYSKVGDKPLILERPKSLEETAFNFFELLKADQLKPVVDYSTDLIYKKEDFNLEDDFNVNPHQFFQIGHHNLCYLEVNNHTVNNFPFPTVNTSAKFALDGDRVVIQSIANLSYFFKSGVRVNDKEYIVHSMLAINEPLRFIIDEHNGKPRLHTQLKPEKKAYITCALKTEILDRETSTKLFSQIKLINAASFDVPLLDHFMTAINRHLNSNKFFVAALKNAAPQLREYKVGNALDINAFSPVWVNHTNTKYNAGDYNISVSEKGMVHIEVIANDINVSFDIALHSLIYKMANKKQQQEVSFKPSVFAVDLTSHKGGDVSVTLDNDKTIMIKTTERQFTIDLKKIRFDEALVGRMMLKAI